MPESKHTPGPWKWRRFGKNLTLVGQHSDVPIVMDFVREGMQGSTARFRNDLGIMCKADRDPVGDDFPDAALIASAPNLLAEVAKLREERDALVADVGRLKRANVHWHTRVRELRFDLETHERVVEERDEALEALKKYGGHLKDGVDNEVNFCALLVHSDNKCDCGWSAVLAKVADGREVDRG